MKTSIIISSVAALCLMITIVESPSRKSNNSRKSFPVNPVAYFTTQKSNSQVESTALAYNFKLRENKPSLTSSDLSYLKFDVTDYIDENEILSEDIIKSDYTNLKFNVADFYSTPESKVIDETILPQSDLEYLKFHVETYMVSEKEESIEPGDPNKTDFSYLKFDVNTFAIENVETASSVELPSREQN
jgi:hypothetical protein